MRNPIELIISSLAPHLCVGCGAEPSLLCPSCIKKLPINNMDVPDLPDVDTVWAVLPYDGHTKTLVHLLKFSRAKSAALIIAGLLDASLPPFSSNVVIVPTPTANSRIRRRGYDQAVLIARPLARKRNLTYRHVLRRRTNTRQVGASKKQRKAQMEDSFIIVNASDLKNSHVILIDDVMTTGATLSSAAQLLRLKGAQSVCAAVVAYKP